MNNGSDGAWYALSFIVGVIITLYFASKVPL